MARTYNRDSRGRFASGGGAGLRGGDKGSKQVGSSKGSKSSGATKKTKPSAPAKPHASTPVKPKTAARPKNSTRAAPVKSGERSTRLRGNGQGGILRSAAAVGAVIRYRLRREEVKIKNSGVENAVLINRRGKVVYRGTENDSNNVKLGKKGRFYGDHLTITHNHPERGNPGYDAGVRGSRLTAGLSPGDIKAGIRTYAREIRAIGSTRSYSFKPSYQRIPNIGTVVKGAKTFESDIHLAFAKGRDARIRAETKIRDNFNKRIDAARRQWWNPVQRIKAARIQKMKDRSLRALAATAHFQEQANAMRALRSQGYNITARRNRTLQTTSRRRPRRRR